MSSSALERAAAAVLEASGAGMGRGALVVELDASGAGESPAHLARRILVRLESAGADGMPWSLMRADPAVALLGADDSVVVPLLVRPSAAAVEEVGEVLAELGWTGVIVADDALAAQAVGLGFVRGHAGSSRPARIVVEEIGEPAGEVSAPAVALSAALGVGRVPSRRALRRIVVDARTDAELAVAWFRRDVRAVVARRAGQQVAAAVGRARGLWRAR